ncbi:MAG TPA: UvrD-helicase domain-containing protein [Syntrophorhabdaceae bacterium]|nr:UvrD-helicase domain-containing protein [Syntrophorhabdaceae bacterium]
MNDAVLNPAERSAKEALDHMCACIDQNKNFLLEAGAGAGKTYSLKYALKRLIQEKGNNLLRQRQQVACISYTNVASEQISSGIDRHPAIHSSTIHSFCWSMIKDYQPFMRNELPNMSSWSEKIEEAGGIKSQSVGYDDLGWRAIDEAQISLHHDDVLDLTFKLMNYEKFRTRLVTRYPILFIDEYQDTNVKIAQALRSHFLDSGQGPLMGFFGDHWQKIYGSGCGRIEHPALEVIGKEANFRSVPVIVDVLNRMRPELPQQVKDPTAQGSVAVYHTNDWRGVRRTGQHWGDDLPAEVAHEYLRALVERLITEGWNFSPDKSKILMLTHKVLAREQGYNNLADVFPYNDAFIKKEDTHIAFFMDTLEPVCIAYENKHFGEMFAALGTRTPAIRSHTDKTAWARDMDTLLTLRSTGTIGAVLDHLRQSKRPRLPEAAERKEQKLQQWLKDPNMEDASKLERLHALRAISYQEVVALSRYINSFTPFETKHGVKGAEFENVLVVVGRGWNQYNFNQFLEWANSPATVPSEKRDTFERNRNLFYVTCSRPTTRLAVLFTQQLSNPAMVTLAKWFGTNTIHSLQIGR